MGLLQLIEQARRGPGLAWPTRDAPRFEAATGHWPSYDPEAYGDYIATSNDVYAAATLRARLVSSLRLRLYNGRDADKREITSGQAVELLRHVNPFWTQKRLLRMDEQSMCLWGESFWAVEHDGRGPREIWWCKPTRMRPVPHEKKYLAGFLYLPEHGGPAIPFRTDEVVWFRYPNPNDEFQSLSPLAAARLAADTGQAMVQANRNLFANGLLAGGLVVPETSKVTFSPKQAEELEALLEDRWKGVDKAHRWSVLRYEAKLQSLNVTPKDAEFVKGLNLTLRQVANAYGIPVPLLNDLEHATLANVRDLLRFLWEDTLIPDVEFKAEEIEEQLLPLFGRRPGPPASPDHVEFDFSKVPALQESASQSWARERQAIDVGALTVNEWRKSKGYPPVAWGDVWWAPVNKSAVSKASSKPQGDTAPTGDDQDADVEQAAGALAALELGHLELRHGPLTLTGNGRNGHMEGAR